MNAARVSVLLSALALGGVGFLYYKVDEIATRLGSARRSETGRVPIGGDALRETSETPPLLVSRGSPAPGQGVNPGPGARPVQERAEELENRLLRLEEKERARELAGPGEAAHLVSMPRFYRDVDHLASDLKMTATQKDRVQSAIERAKGEIEQVLRIPDESGKSPWDRRREQEAKIQEMMRNPNPEGAMAFVATALADRSRKIPGRDVTYGQEIDRIKKDAREDIERNLDEKQKESLRGGNLDPLFGPDAGGGEMSFAVSFGTAQETEPGK